jgi:hypothetical protein
MSQRSNRPAADIHRRPETKSFILTSEFWVAAGAAAAVFLAGYVLNDIADTTTWRYGVWLAIAYIISRGIAKAGSQRAYQTDTATQARSVWTDGDGTPDPELQVTPERRGLDRLEDQYRSPGDSG